MAVNSGGGTLAAGPAVNLKILVPAVASGAIIGKGGETIAEVQKATGTRIKMSKANDFYPGTTERVGLIQGTNEAVLRVMDFIAQKMVEKPDPTAKPAIDFDNKVCAEREKQIKIIVPNSTAGMIIGKGGTFIKQLKDESGAFIQISQKSKETTLPERVVTIIGENLPNRKALEMIICKIQEDPQSASCLNISYGEIQGLVANPHPTGSPYAPVIPNGTLHSEPAPSVPAPSVPILPSSGVRRTASPPPSNSSNSNPFSLNLPNGRSMDLTVNATPGWPITEANVMNQYLKQITLNLRSHGFTENTVEEIIRSISCLATHGILSVENAELQWSSNLDTSPPVNRVISADVLAPVNTNSYGLGTSAQNGDVVDIEVEENVIGAVIGPGGRSIVDLQQFSGARIQVSQKDHFSPGTRNRMVTITGPKQAVATAKYLIEKRIQDEDENRQLQNY